MAREAPFGVTLQGRVLSPPFPCCLCESRLVGTWQSPHPTAAPAFLRLTSLGGDEPRHYINWLYRFAFVGAGLVPAFTSVVRPFKVAPPWHEAKASHYMSGPRLAPRWNRGATVVTPEWAGPCSARPGTRSSSWSPLAVRRALWRTAWPARRTLLSWAQRPTEIKSR